MIQNKLKEIKGKSEKQIKEELEKQGVKLSGKSPSLMKVYNLYVFAIMWYKHKKGMIIQI